MKKLFSSLALAVLVMLGASGIASAQTMTYTKCTDVPSVNSGNVVVNQTGACTLDNTSGYSTTGYFQIMATGAITVTAETPFLISESYLSIQGKDTQILTPMVSTQSYLYIANTDGAINVTGTIQAAAGNILLISQKNLAAGPITGAANFNVDLKAWVSDTGGMANNFAISSSGNGNGVNGAITTYAPSAIYITNGGASSTAEINLTKAAGLLTVNSAPSSLGAIILNAQQGSIKMPNTILSVDGNGVTPAGVIELLAQTVSFPDKGGLSASQTGTVTSSHGVAVAAAEVDISIRVL